MNTRNINGAGKHFLVTTTSLTPSSLGARIILQANGLLKDWQAKEIGLDGAKGGLKMLTDMANNSAGEITDPSQRADILKSIDGVWNAIYAKKYLDDLMHKGSGPTTYARFLCTFRGDTAGTTDAATQDFILAAASLDKKHGWIAHHSQ